MRKSNKGDKIIGPYAKSSYLVTTRALLSDLKKANVSLPSFLANGKLTVYEGKSSCEVGNSHLYIQGYYYHPQYAYKYFGDFFEITPLDLYIIYLYRKHVKGYVDHSQKKRIEVFFQRLHRDFIFREIFEQFFSALTYSKFLLRNGKVYVITSDMFFIRDEMLGCIYFHPHLSLPSRIHMTRSREYYQIYVRADFTLDSKEDRKLVHTMYEFFADIVQEMQGTLRFIRKHKMQVNYPDFYTIGAFRPLWSILTTPLIKKRLDSFKDTLSDDEIIEGTIRLLNKRVVRL